MRKTISAHGKPVLNFFSVNSGFACFCLLTVGETGFEMVFERQ